MKLEELNARAKKVGLNVAAAKKPDLYTIRKASSGKQVAKNVTAAEALEVIEARD